MSVGYCNFAANFKNTRIMEDIFSILIGLIVDLVIVILCAGFLGCMVCDSMGVEFDGGTWVLSVIVCFGLFGIPMGLVLRHIMKK